MIGPIRAAKLRNLDSAGIEAVLGKFLGTEVLATDDEWLIQLEGEKDFSWPRLSRLYGHIGHVSIVSTKTKVYCCIRLHQRTKEILRSEDLLEQRKNTSVTQKDAQMES